jgi:hypothetical protein
MDIRRRRQVQPKERSDVRQRILLLIPLSRFDNGAYYLQVLICLRTAKLFSVSKQAQGGVEVPSPDKHR